MIRNNIRDINYDSFWKLESREEKVKFLLKFAVLAPSTHNSQPWLFKVRDSVCEIFYDKNLKIPKADPNGRDLYISIGCATENLKLASNGFGVETKINLGPFSEKEKVVEVEFENLDSGYTQLDTTYLNLIKKRQNARGKFLDTKVSIDLRERLIQIANSHELQLDFIEGREKIEKMSELTGKGMRIAYKDKDFRKEMSYWMSNSLSSRKEGLPGYSLKMPFLLSFILPTIVRFFNIGKKLAYLNSVSIKSAPIMSVISSEKNDPITWLKVGMSAEHMMLEVLKSNLNTSIFVASIEIGDIYNEVKKIIGTNNRPQFVFAIGKIDSLHKQTPRYSVEEKLI